MDPVEEFPRQIARTRRFTLGVPRSFTVSPDAERVVFLRSDGDDPMSGLWVFDVADGAERLVFAPGMEEAEGELTDAERARRERAREQSSGVTAYATDRAVRRAVFTVAGRMFLGDLVDGSARELAAPGSVDDPRLDPTGERIAFVVGGDLHVREVRGGERQLAAAEEPDTFWGLAEFVAAEEMERRRGHWWSPDGTKTRGDARWTSATCSCGTSAIRRIRPPRLDRSGTRRREPPTPSSRSGSSTWRAANVARSGGTTTGSRTWLVCSGKREALSRCSSRRGISGRSGSSRPTSTRGETALVAEQTDPEWIDLPDQAPTRLSDGRIVTVVADRGADTYRLTVGAEPVTPPGLQVRTVVSAGEGVLFRASEGDPTQIHLWRWMPDDGATRISTSEGLHAGVEGGDVLVLTSATPEELLSTTTVFRKGEPVAVIENRSERPVIEARPKFLTLGERELRAALLLPNGREPDAPLPVLMDPYGFPHGARVLRAAGAHVTSQWFADQGFAVLVVDGRGVDGRGPAWDREMRFDFTIAVEDQADALQAAAERFPYLDVSRVGIRGWSGGGYLSAMAVLRRPDVFHAAVVGAPVTDVRLYDTHYMERYLGDPNGRPEVYDLNSFVADAPNLERPMLLIHGLADDNVFVANTLRLSAALFEAGRHHELVLIPNATHLTRSTAVTENVLRVQLDFLRRSLAR